MTDNIGEQEHMAAPTAAPATNTTVEGINAPGLQLFVFALFFIFGGITSLNDVIIPKLKELFTLSYFQAMLINSAFFLAYFAVGIPGAALVKRFGYMRSAVVGLSIMVVGCFAFIPASQTANYLMFLLAMFVLASGVVIVQVVSNPLITLLGPQATASSRLTFAQAFNSLGTTVFPAVGSVLILGSLAGVSASDFTGAALDAYRTAETQMIVRTYLGLAAALAVVAGVVWLFRNTLKGEQHEQNSIRDGFSLLNRPRFSFGALCIFLYVGAEVAIGSIIVNYLMQPGVMGLDQRNAGEMIAYYWGGAMVGRFIGSAILRVISPGKVLAFNALAVVALVLISANTSGTVSGYSLLAIGLMNSIMFPTIFTLACEGLGSRAADGSGIINVAIVGGAVVPPLTGLAADMTSLGLSLAIPAICYAVIAAFGVYAHRNRVVNSGVVDAFS
jgi:MFS transporter, FHS family, L-fucose permease